MADISGSTIGRRYMLHESLGKGGMGVVYRATDRLTGREVALKRVSTDAEVLGIDNSFEAVDFRLALAREFKLSSSLRHPNVITVLDYGFDEAKQPYFTMELLASPRTILEASQSLPINSRIELLVQVLQALTYLHRRGILHRDLKPANVLVADKTVKVLDFGLSVMRERSGDHHEADNEGTTAGTLAYMAPEILMSEPSGVPADLYAVGMMGYEMIVGQHPFTVNDMGKLINEIMFVMPDINAMDVSMEVAGIIERLLQKDPSARYQSAAEVAEALRAAINLPQATEISAIRESFLQAAALVGREAEIKQLSEALNNTLNHQGSAWLIAGENGVGKSRLLDELRRLAMVQGAVVMRGQAVRVGSRPYELWLPIFRWLPLLAGELTSGDIGLLKLFIPDIHLLLQRSVDDIEAPQLPPQTLRTRLKELIERVLHGQTTPIVMLLEDLHWAGSESLHLFKEVVQWTGGLPLMVVATYRDDEAPDLFTRLPGLPLMKLRRLSEQAIADLSAAMLGEGGRSPQVVDLLRRETEGNVFFVVEVVRALAEEVGNLEQIGRMTLPQKVFSGGIRTVIARRLEKVDKASRELLRLAASMGRELDLTLLRVLAPQTDIQDWLTRCASAAILEVEDDQWHFAHDKFRETLLDELTGGEREALHRRVARGLENYYGDGPSAHVVALAYHFGQAGEPAKEERYVTFAGEQALRSGAYHEAVDFLRRAMTLLTKMDLAPDDLNRKQVHLYQRMAEAHQGFGDYKEARRLHIEALQLCERLHDKAGIAACQGHLGDVALVLNELDEARAFYEKSLALYREVGDNSGVARTLNRLGNVAYERGEDAAARQLYQESLSLARQIGQEWAMAGSVRTQTTAAVKAGQADYQRAKDLFEQTLALYTQTGNQAGMAATLYNLGVNAQDSGHLDEAQDYYRRSVTLRQTLNDKTGLAQVYERLGMTALARKDFGAARDFFRQSLQAAAGSEVTALALHTLLGMAQLYSARGEGRQALELLAFLLDYSGSPESLQDAAETLIFDLEATLPADMVEKAYSTGKGYDLATIVEQLLK